MTKATRVSHRRSAEGADGPLPAALAGLLTPRAYPHPAAAIEVIETPISWVVLAGAFAYKIKRPVRYPFVDQRSPAHRHRLCQAELRLNRRFARELYLEVCAIVSAGADARVHLGPVGRIEVAEYAVRMHRFAAGDVLDRQLGDGRIGVQPLEHFGRTLADIHSTLPTAPLDAPWGQPASVRALLSGNLLECAAAAAPLGGRKAVLALRSPLARRLAEADPWMTVRRANARVRECHGDLHSRNIVVRDGRLVAFDCLEYEPSFRWIDVADEIAFLSSDLASGGHRAHARAFLGGYLERSGDYHACRLIKLYEAHRALVRAKVAALSAAARPDEPALDALRAEFERLVAHATAALSDRHPHLVLMSGLSGSGKTWVARQLAERLDAVHLRSDVERKRRAGLEVLERSGSALGAGLYSAELSERAYEDLAREACDALTGGYTVIVDATLLRREQRRRFAELGASAHAPMHLVRCTAPLAVLRERLRSRAAAAQDPSEADLSVLEWQRGRIEPLAPNEPFESIEVDSSDARAIETLLARLGEAAMR